MTIRLFNTLDFDIFIGAGAFGDLGETPFLATMTLFGDFETAVFGGNRLFDDVEAVGFARRIGFFGDCSGSMGFLETIFFSCTDKTRDAVGFAFS